MRGILLGGALVTGVATALAVGAARLGSPDGSSSGSLAATGSSTADARSASGARFFGATPEMIQQVRECSGAEPDRFYEFYFTRAIYSEYGGGDGRRGRGFRGGGDWAMDYPKADCQFITVVKRLAGVDMFDDSNATRLDDPNLRSFPFLYALEVGRGGGMNLTELEVVGLRNYLLAGGFLVIDDFWGTQEWRNFERQITEVLPGKEIVEIPMDHPLFGIFYEIDEVIQVPISGNAEAIALGYPGAVTYENDGYEPHVRGIFDDKGRPMVIINWNTDLGDAWEYAESPYYPLHFSTFAFRMGVNMILYGMTH